MPARKRIAVVGLADGPEASEGPSVLACLDRSRYERVAVLCHENESGALQVDACERVLLVPRPGSSAYVSNLVDAVRAEGLDVLLPGNAVAAVQLARAAQILRSAGVGLLPHTDDAASDPTLASGVRIAPRQRLSGVPVLGACGPVWPVLLQSTCGARRRAGDEWEALRAHEALLRGGAEQPAASGVDVIAWMPNAAFEVALIADEDGAVLASSSIRVLADDDRLRPWMTVSVENETLVRAAVRSAEELDLLGASRYLFLRDEHGFALVDARPGFPLWIETTLFDGPSLVELAVRSALGEELTVPETIPCTPAGVLFSQTAEDVVDLTPR